MKTPVNAAYGMTPEDLDLLRTIAQEAVLKVQAKRRQEFKRTETKNGCPAVTNMTAFYKGK